MNQEQKRPHPRPNVLKALFHQLTLTREHNPKSFDQQISDLPLIKNQISIFELKLWRSAATTAILFRKTLLAQLDAIQGSVRERLELERFRS